MFSLWDVRGILIALYEKAAEFYAAFPIEGINVRWIEVFEASYARELQVLLRERHPEIDARALALALWRMRKNPPVFLPADPLEGTNIRWRELFVVPCVQELEALLSERNPEATEAGVRALARKLWRMRGNPPLVLPSPGPGDNN